MLDARLLSNIEDIVKNLSDLEKKHVPFAMAHALTATVYEGQKVVRGQMPERFTLRRSWAQRGVRVKIARPGDFNAAIYTLDWFMKDQETGGTRKPRGSALWIPTMEARSGGVLTGQVLSRYKPRAIKSQMSKGRKEKRASPGKGGATPRRPFIAGYRHGSGQVGDWAGEGLPEHAIYIRKGPGRYPLARLYVLAPEAKLPPRWGFFSTLESVSEKQLRVRFIKSLSKALETNKGGAIRSGYVDHLKSTVIDEISSSPLGSTPTFAQTLASNG